MAPKMSFAEAHSILESHATEYGGLIIDASLADVSDSIWRGILDGLFDRPLAEAISVVWEHYERRTKKIEYLPRGESVLGLDSLLIDADGDHEVYLRTVVEEYSNLFSDLSAGEDSDE